MGHLRFHQPRFSPAMAFSIHTRLFFAVPFSATALSGVRGGAGLHAQRQRQDKQKTVQRLNRLIVFTFQDPFIHFCVLFNSEELPYPRPRLLGNKNAYAGQNHCRRSYDFHYIEHTQASVSWYRQETLAHPLCI